MQPATKKSKQRDAIIKFLMTRKDHPTADMVYMNIKEEVNGRVPKELLPKCPKCGRGFFDH